MILITGPESTGKSTLAEQLSQELDMVWIPEYSRNYLEINGPDYGYDDIEKMAKEHHSHIVNLNEHALILDTFALNYKIWSEFKYGNVSPLIINMLDYFNFKKVLLLKPDILWESDPLRENPHNRQELFETYIKELDLLKWNYAIVDGQGQERLNKALKALK